MQTKQCSNLQQGFSLIELMIASALSLVLVAGVATIYMGSRQTYNARDELSTMQENARSAINALAKHLEHAGYTTSAHLPLAKAFYVDGDPVPASKSCGGGANSLVINPQTLVQTADNNLSSGTGDTIGVIFYADSVLGLDCGNEATPLSCQAQEAPNPEYSRVYNSFYVGVEGGIPNLFCAGSRSQAAIPVAEGVEALQFAYGLDQNDDGTVDIYLDATAVKAANRWYQVRTIKASVLVRSREPVFNAAEARNYTLLNTTYNRNDRYQRTVHTTVIYLRNLDIYQGGV
ncbi:PilW family protein [uncultured Thiothrix sp.]|mgnify:CR=1 FL=1|uniref:PilW family protein n=1 Tax=uncultured Thiothrix sp. TaxID=223185 RepID=UPI00262FBFC9|nr:PilW family protein [uncultured Thiothrix sp.]HMT93390.1 PilW family protein [Thiolinea sp.]